MKYILNKLTSKTTNNFHVNDVTLDLNLNELNFLGDIKVNNAEYDYQIVSDKLSSKIGLDVNKYINLNIKVINDKPIYIDFDFQNNDTLYLNINLDYQNLNSDVVIHFNSKDLNEHFVYTKVKVINGNGSLNIINKLNSKSTLLFAFESDNKNIFKCSIIDLNGKNRIYNINENGYENSKQIINMIYYTSDEELLDMNYVLNNIGKKACSIIDVKGSQNDESIKTFRGTIDFKKGSIESIGKESESDILLSDTCKSKSLPILLCSEENVEGSHSFSCGNIDEEKLFYLLSRGISLGEAKMIILKASFQSIINDLPICIKDEVIKLIDNTFLNLL